MDIREQIVQNIQRLMMPILTDEQMDALADAMTIELHKYEIQERHTELTVVDDGPERLLKKFLATKKIEGLSDSTLKRYYEINMELIRFLKKPLNEVQTDDLRFFLALRRRNDRVCNRTLDGMRRIYSSFFGWLAAERYIHWNPCASLKKIKYKKKVKKAFSTVEMQRIREACKTDRDIALIDFLYYSGCRVSEVASIDVNDIDYDEKCVTVLGKGNKERTVYLTDIAMMHICKYIGDRRTGALFRGRGSKRLTKIGIEAAVKKIGQQAGVNNVHCHRFRRTLASNLIQKGVNILTVAQILGHADLRTTQEYCYIGNTDVHAAYRTAFAA